MTSAFYKPTYISGNETGLVQSRQNFILPNDAYPVLQNAFVWRERIKRKNGYRLLGRLRRVFTDTAIGNSGASPWSFNLFAIVVPPITETNKEIEVGSVIIDIGGTELIDQGDGTLETNPVSGLSGIINYITGDIVITGTGGGGVATIATFNYFPGLPVMGLRTRDLNNINNEQMIAFDQVYAYRFIGSGFEEFIPGTIWTGNDSDFFWSTNYWVGDGNQKIFWVTNFSGPGGDPIRYTNGTTWEDFAPQIDAAGNLLNQCLAILPFRGRLVTFNTFEGPNLGTSIQYRQRIRWAEIGTPFYRNDGSIVTVGFVADAWRDDIPGRGGFLDIPTSENITAVGFVRDNLVIYCESSTWQLKYTGRSIAPFQIEKVNTELGAESTFSAVQFDTSLVGIGDKGVVECDSYQSNRIDIKIPDLVFRFNNDENGPKRVHGIRDFQQRIAYWTYPESGTGAKFPNRRLLYNYENDSWAIFTDSFTTLGTFQPQSSLRWSDFPNDGDPNHTWEGQDDTQWNNEPFAFPAIVGGNQQGFVEYLGQINFDAGNSNSVSLSITAITGNTTTATQITSPNHNLQDTIDSGQVIEIIQIPTGTPFATSLNRKVFGVSIVDADNFLLFKYSPQTQIFNDPQLDSPGDYVGGGKILIRDNFIIQSKKFNFLEQGQSIQMGFIDILTEYTVDGAFSLNVYVDYNDSQAVNVLPQNVNEQTQLPDPFFNSVIPTYSEVNRGSTKNFQRIYCQARGAFVTLEYTFSNAQMAGNEQLTNVQIDSQILWMRPAGRQLAVGV